MKLKPVKKAYRVWVHEMLLHEHPEFTVDNFNVVYGKNATEAKSKCEYWRDYKNEYNEMATWIDIHCKRVPEQDLFEYNGIPRTRKQIEKEMEKGKRIDRLNNLDETDMFYLQDARGYVGNCVSWWAINGGYCCDITKAEKFTKEKILKKDIRDTDIVWSARHVEKNIKQVIDIQNIHRDYSV